jgi:cupin fold WbuC family metalloprotein
MKRLSEEVYAVDEPIAHLGQAEIDYLKNNVYQTKRRRIRVCTHRDIQEKLHEMFVCYVKETYVRPNKHFKKDESLHIIQGTADFIFFDEKGQIIDIAPLGDYASGRNFYCRIPESVYHTFVIKSDIIVIHESIPGPFCREDTAFAPWAPEEENLQAVNDFMINLAQHAEKY